LPKRQLADGDIAVLGRVLAPFGVRGWVKVRPYTAELASLIDHGTWWLAVNAEAPAWQQFEVLTAQEHGQTVLAQLGNLTSREAAMAWRGALVGVPRASLPAAGPGEHYWSDLVGLAVVNRAGVNMGRVAGLLDTGAHGVLRVTSSAAGKELLIPLVAAYVEAIDVEAGRILVDWELDY
jgi:16S rRNA processing protein RimM